MKNILIVIVALFVVLFAGIHIMTSGGSLIGNAAIYIGLSSAFVSLVRPRVGMIIFFILSGYSDLLKRFMILDDYFGYSDIASVLSMAPLTLGAIVTAVFLQGIFGRTLRSEDYVIFLLCTGMLCLQALLALKDGGGLVKLRVLADYGVFIYLVFVIPILYPSLEAIKKLLKTVVVIFVPVALYAVKQKMFGFSNFELAYLESGFTIESRQLEDVTVRAFSTLNAASSLTLVCAACGLLSLVLYRTKSIRFITFVFFIITFIAGCYATLSRTGWVVFAIGLFLPFLFRKKIGAFAFYGIIVVIGIITISSADYVLDNLQDWQTKITGKQDFGRTTQALRITTLSDRFLGFKNLKNPENWTLFGLDLAQARTGLGRYDSRAFSHDLISETFFRFGAVPFFGVLLVGLIVILKSHNVIYRTRGIPRKFAIGALACLVALGLSLAAGASLFQFPSNVFLWTVVSLLIVSLRVAKQERHHTDFVEDSDTREYSVTSRLA